MENRQIGIRLENVGSNKETDAMRCGERVFIFFRIYTKERRIQKRNEF